MNPCRHTSLGRLLLTAVAWVVITAVAVASNSAPVSAGRPREFRGITVGETGLRDLVVNAFFQDSTGFVWIGTGNGVDRFDGVNMRHYEIPSSNPTLRRVNVIRQGPGEEVYAGTGEGLFLLNSPSGSPERLFQKEINFAVNDVAFRNEEMYLATDRGLFIRMRKGDRLLHVLPARDVISRGNAVMSITADPRGHGLWMSGDSRVMFYDFVTRSLAAFDYDDPSCRFGDITAIGDSLYLATARFGVVGFDAVGHTFRQLPPVGNNIVSSLSSDGKGTLYVSTDGSGVFFIDAASGEVVSNYSYDPHHGEGTLRSNSVYSMMVDRNGLLWVGYYQNGLDYTPLKRGIFEIYRHGDLSTEGMTVRAFAMDGPEKLIGTREGLYFVDEKTGRHASFAMPKMRSNMVFTICKLNGLYYVGTYGGGMYVFNPATLTLSDFAPGIAALHSGNVFTIVADSEGVMWIGTSEGVFRWRGGQFLPTLTSENSRLPQGNVYDIYFDSENRGWICTENGMAVWDGTSLRTDGFPRGFINREKIRNVYEDSAHNLYFQPDQGQVIRSNMELTRFAPVGGYSAGVSPSAAFLIEDGEGKMWYGSGYGLSRGDGDDSFRQFTSADGIPSPIFTLCKPVRDERGGLWLGNSGGLLHITGDKLRGIDTPHPTPVITDILVNEQSCLSEIDFSRKTPRVRLPSDGSALTLRFSDFSFTATDDIMMEVWLDGVDDDWRPVVGKGSVRYHNLPAGSHMLHVRQAGQPDTETRMELRVDRPVAWGMIIMVVVAIGIAGGALKFAQLRRRRGEVEEPQSVDGDAVSADGQQPSPAEEKYRTTRLSDEECRRLLKVIDGLMKKERPYTNPDLKIADLAAMAGSSPHALSFLFNQYLKTSYYDYVNRYRVEEFKRVVDAVDTSRYTLTALSQRCGFSSRTSFFRHFKKLTGITPAEYLKQKDS